MKWKLDVENGDLAMQRFSQGALQQMWLINFICVWSDPQNFTRITFVNPVLNKEKIPTFETFFIHPDD